MYVQMVVILRKKNLYYIELHYERDFFSVLDTNFIWLIFKKLLKSAVDFLEMCSVCVKWLFAKDVVKKNV